MANYYRWFVKNFAKIARPLHEIMRKENKWSWGERQQIVFEKLKKRFMTEPDLDKEIIMRHFGHELFYFILFFLILLFFFFIFFFFGDDEKGM